MFKTRSKFRKELGVRSLMLAKQIKIIKQKVYERFLVGR